MTWATIIAGIVIPVVGWLLRLGYLSWKESRTQKREVEVANDTAAKHKREAELHAQPARTIRDNLDRLRKLRGK